MHRRCDGRTFGCQSQRRTLLKQKNFTWRFYFLHPRLVESSQLKVDIGKKRGPGFC